jgi:hypothetical protein
MEVAAFDRLFFDRNYRRDGRLVVRLRLGHRRSREMAIGLKHVFDELHGFRCRATNHYPESKVDFQGEYHPALPLFDF